MSKNAYVDLSHKYREKGGGHLSDQEVDAYLKARMPATFAAVKFALEQVAMRVQWPIQSLLDLGAGPGTGFLAAREVFPEIEKGTLVERNEAMIKKSEVEGDWVKSDLLHYQPAPHDLVLFAYSLGELSDKSEILKRAWEAAQILVIVEPGTPRGFENILKAREQLIGWGGHLVAPCPHARACPMQKGQWCHFSVRLQRTREHRLLKGGQLGFEDEKFSYVAFAKQPVEMAKARVIGHPQKCSGYVELHLCTQEGLVHKKISKKEQSLYKEARKAKWGDPLQHIT